MPRQQRPRSTRRRTLRCEPLESRHLLTQMADIVFLVDESGSEQTSRTHDWLETAVAET